MSFRKPHGIAPHYWQRLIDTLRNSKNPYERESVYFGVVAADGSPILVDRRHFREHVHFLGSTGGGKSSMGLAPLIEQLISFGDSTVVIIDLKGGSNELLAAVNNARAQLKARTGRTLPLKHFTTENGKPTCSFNPLTSKQWLNFSPLQRTDVLSAASGLIYGSDYGRAFYTAANAAVVYAAEQLSIGERNFRALQKDVAGLLQGKGGNDLPRELRQAGVHVYEILTRFASINQLNTEPGDETEIDFVDCFRTPQILYMKFPSAVSMLSSSAVARLAAYFLMASAGATEERCQVYLVIDEFQRMAAESLSILFEQARSMDVSLILSNHSIEDLGQNKSGLMNLVETNCNTRQWFSFSSVADIKRLETIGSTVDKEVVTTTIKKSNAGVDRIEMRNMQSSARMSVAEATYVSNDTNLSILKVSGVRHGYAHYRGLPFVVRNQFHITEEEYLRRLRFEWPEIKPGMMLAGESAPPPLIEGNAVKAIKKTPFPESKTAPSSEIEFSDWTPDGF